jgi:hypothetical protein
MKEGLMQIYKQMIKVYLFSIFSIMCLGIIGTGLLLMSVILWGGLQNTAAGISPVMVAAGAISALTGMSEFILVRKYYMHLKKVEAGRVNNGSVEAA